MKRVLRYFGFLALVLGILFGLSCNSGSPENLPTPVNAPVISSFTADPKTLNKGDYSTLSWSVTNATSCSIDNGIGAAPNSGTELVDPEVTTVYTLTATNEAGSVTKTCQVEVVYADIQLQNYSKETTSYHCPEVVGTAKNIGTGPGYNVMIAFKAWNSSNQSSIKSSPKEEKDNANKSWGN